MAGAVGLAVIIYAFSRIMLAVSKSAGPAIFVVAAALITLFGFLFSARPNLRTQLVGALCAVGALIVVAGGVASAAVGERESLAVAEREDHFSAAHRECLSSEVTEGDEHAGNTVAMKSNIWATFTLADGQLTAREIGGKPAQVITVDRGNQVSVLFENKTSESRRLTIYAGQMTETVDGVDETVDHYICTHTIEKNNQAFLTFNFPAQNPEDPYYAFVPGFEDSKVQVVVP
ncbi:MAG: hypothetical protein R2715_05825 [Ilumatobacteraceae bacterium]